MSEHREGTLFYDTEQGGMIYVLIWNLLWRATLWGMF